MFGKLFNRTKREVVKFDKRDMAEATVAGAVLVMFADGEVEAKEVGTLEAIISANPSFSAFGSEIHVMVEKFMTIMNAGSTLGKVKVMKEIRDCQNNEDEKAEIFATLVDIAKSDGEVKPAETAVLKEVAKELGVVSAHFGIE